MSEIKTNKISPRKGTTQTIGDSGDTITIPCGATLDLQGTFSNLGTVTGIDGLISWDTTAKTTNFTAVSGNGYFIDTTSGAITVTFPASPTAGDVIGLKDYANTFDTNNLTINRNGNNIQGIANNFTISVEGTSAQFIYVDATRGWVLTDASKASDIAEGPTFICATGGTITTCGDYKIHTFTSPGTFCVSCAGPGNVDYLVVAGGGGGAGSSPAGGTGSGGGAGGYRESYCSTISGCYTASPLATCTSLSITATGYPITVGGGGAGGCGNPTADGSVGNNSVFSSITSAGGGNGITFTPTGRNSGSGGSGAGGVAPGCAGAGNTPPVSPPQGNPGGAGNGSAPGYGTGGGGGALVVGGNGTTTTGGPGGNGATTSISGSPTAYAGGGGGSIYSPPGVSIPGGGTGGTGGGGDASSYNTGVSGTANTGGGGGGAGSGPTGVQCTTGGAGGSGVVIIRYKYQ